MPNDLKDRSFLTLMDLNAKEIRYRRLLAAAPEPYWPGNSLDAARAG